MARTKHTPLKEGIVAHTKQTGGEELPPAQQSKRRAAAVVVKPCGARSEIAQGTPWVDLEALVLH